MLEKQVKYINSKRSKEKEAKELKMKKEEDFHEEAIEVKCGKTFLVEKMKQVGKENKVLYETVEKDK